MREKERSHLYNVAAEFERINELVERRNIVDIGVSEVSQIVHASVNGQHGRQIGVEAAQTGRQNLDLFLKFICNSDPKQITAYLAHLRVQSSSRRQCSATCSDAARTAA